jgi:GTP:adenosylcobinamide-phosphate guanylyltransferase
MKMDAVVIAGGTPTPGDPLFSFTQGKPKALLELAGKPMIQWILDALDGAETIERVIVVGLDTDCGVAGAKVCVYTESKGDILPNIRYGVEQALAIHPAAEYVAVVSSDIPAILPQHVDWVVNSAMQSREDVYYNVITRQVMEARYPGSNRSYVRLKDVEVCGGDLNVVRTSMVQGRDALWERIIAARKNALKQAALLGLDTLLLLLMRQITLERAVEKVTRRLHLSGRALVCPYAEIGMDVDKPHQLKILRADLEQRMSMHV